MNNVDKICKETKLMLDNTRDNVISDVITAIRNGQLKIDQSQMTSIVKIINFSFEDSSQKSLSYFQNSIKKLV